MPKFVIRTDTEQEKKQRCSLLGVMDDPEIDLTDGPIDVKVELCSRQFYLSNYKKVSRSYKTILVQKMKTRKKYVFIKSYQHIVLHAFELFWT